MCFSQPKPPAAPGPDPELTAQKEAQFATNAQKAADEKAAATDQARAKAYGFYGTRSMISGGPGGGMLSGGR